jgi:hypothetical protein
MRFGRQLAATAATRVFAAGSCLWIVWKIDTLFAEDWKELRYGDTITFLVP